MDNKNQGLSQYEIEHGGQATPPQPPIPPAQPVAPQPGATGASGQPAPKPPRDRRKLATILFISLVLLLLLVGTAAAVLLLKKKPAQRETAPVAKETAVPPLTAAKTIEHLRIYFKGTGIAKTAPSTPIMTKDEAYYTIVTDPALVAATSISASLAPADAGSNLDAIRKSLNYDQFTETVLSDGASGTNFLADYTRKDVVCQALTEKSADAKADQYLEVKCLDMKAYEDLAERQEPFFKAYRAASASSASPVIIGPAKVSPSASAGYQLAEVQTANAVDPHHITSGPVAKFYTGPDNVWRFFTDSSGVLACSIYYKSVPLTTAYLNTPCLDGKNKPITVQLKRR